MVKSRLTYCGQLSTQAQVSLGSPVTIGPPLGNNLLAISFELLDVSGELQFTIDAYHIMVG